MVVNFIDLHSFVIRIISFSTATVSCQLVTSCPNLSLQHHTTYEWKNIRRDITSSLKSYSLLTKMKLWNANLWSRVMLAKVMMDAFWSRWTNLILPRSWSTPNTTRWLSSSCFVPCFRLTNRQRMRSHFTMAQTPGEECWRAGQSRSLAGRFHWYTVSRLYASGDDHFISLLFHSSDVLRRIAAVSVITKHGFDFLISTALNCLMFWADSERSIRDNFSSLSLPLIRGAGLQILEIRWWISGERPFTTTIITLRLVTDLDGSQWRS